MAFSLRVDVMRFLIYQFKILIVSIILPTMIIAAPITPNDEAIIATSNVTHSNLLTVEEINLLVTNSQYVGQTERLQGFLKLRLAQLYKQKATPEIGYLYAKVLQKEHLFNEAINIANEVLKAEPYHSNSHLLLANIYMNQGKFKAAKEHCIALIGKISLITTSSCVLDVQSQHGNVLESYQALVKIINIKPTSLETNHILSEMSYRLQNFEQALEHIKNTDLANSPVSLIVLWADIQIALNQPQLVLNTLSDLLLNKNNLEDAILLRLAIAENKMNKNEQKWQNIMAKRVKLREQRKDIFHAGDLAKYYLTVQPNRSKAIYWAHLNWQQAKLSTDKQLISQAKAMPRVTL